MACYPELKFRFCLCSHSPPDGFVDKPNCATLSDVETWISLYTLNGHPINA